MGEQLRRVSLELVVADYDRIGSSDPIGRVEIGYNRRGLELKHWKEMVENPRRPIVHWHVLKDVEPGMKMRKRRKRKLRKGNARERQTATRFNEQHELRPSASKLQVKCKKKFLLQNIYKSM